ncbi:Zinc finger C2H2-type,Zinc finger, RING/FYVE/PHD-type [Cinara cedri]|uniref:Zinc finger C2H2-type,Zinc finger, RING/FYVE/PHD-type n=1 Tax=Cinara cedri TaxID=506608 RepID=A0A5E4MC59_9HEMI|nr:Zinc finger C2H2-type,Zinc finger, RING/FYVE/PHD-type [Cinara cedri]
MLFVLNRPIPVADHFLTFASPTVMKSYAVDGSTASAGTSEADRPRSLPVHDEMCESCFDYCANKTELWKHVRDKHGDDQRLVCPKSGCGKRFPALAMSAAHAAHHGMMAGDRPWSCELCGHFMASLRAFWNHIVKKHPDAVAATCGVCFLYTGDVPSLIDHVRRVHGSTANGIAAAGKPLCVEQKIMRGIRCDVCGRRFGNYRNMFNHRPVHGTVELDSRSPLVARSLPKSHKSNGFKPY